MPRVRELETMERAGSESDSMPLEPVSKYAPDCGNNITLSLDMYWFWLNLSCDSLRKSVMDILDSQFFVAPGLLGMGYPRACMYSCSNLIRL